MDNISHIHHLSEIRSVSFTSPKRTQMHNQVAFIYLECIHAKSMLIICWLNTTLEPSSYTQLQPPQQLKISSIYPKRGLTPLHRLNFSISLAPANNTTCPSYYSSCSSLLLPSSSNQTSSSSPACKNAVSTSSRRRHKSSCAVVASSAQTVASLHTGESVRS